jgi:lipoprotein-anchoring transpeptidase ErfK/SrfK
MCVCSILKVAPGVPFLSAQLNREKQIMNRPATSAFPRTLGSKFAPSALLLTFLALSTTGVAAPTAPNSRSKPSAQATRHIVVSFSDRKLALLEGDRVVKIYDVAVGVPVSPSPSGEFQIVQRLENPTYYKPGVVIAAGKKNPLGTRWLGLNAKGFGLHGTNRPGSIGKNASHGCIRLRNRDIEDLFPRVQVGDRVSLIAERTDEVARLFGGAPSLVNPQETLRASNEPAATSEDEAHGDR